MLSLLTNTATETASDVSLHLCQIDFRIIVCYKTDNVDFVFQSNKEV